MPSCSREPNASTSTSDEQSPLLQKVRSSDNGSLERGQDENNASSAVEDIEEPSTAQLLKMMAGMWLGSFLAALDTTVIATLATPISNSFNSLSLLSWLASAYLIANAAFQPISGKLTDIFSRRTGLIFSNIAFAIGNLICSFATSSVVMILGRVVAGLGGGGLFAIGTFAMSDVVPLRKRGIWQGFGNVCFGLGSGLGGVFGGWVNDTWGWRKAFIIQVPLTVVSAVIVWFTIHIPVKKTSKAAWRRIDYPGAITLMAALILLLLGLNSGGNNVPWNHPLVLVSLPLSAVFLAVFIYIESSYASEPIIPVKLMLNRTVFAACLANWFSTMFIFSILFYTPIYFQVAGSSTTQAGIRLIPYSIGVVVGSLGSGFLMRLLGKYYILTLGCDAVFLAAAILLSTFTLSTPTWESILFFLFAGTGYGSMLTITLLALIAAVDHEYQAVITSASYAFRSTGGTIGITIASAVFQNILKLQLWARFGDEKDAADTIARLRDNFDEIHHVPESWKAGVLDAYMDALRGAFWTVSGILVLGLLVSLLMREHKLHSTISRK